MNGAAFFIFGTPIGTAAVAWRGEALLGTWLPETDPDRLRHAIRQRFPRADSAIPPEPVAEMIFAIVRLLCGEPEDLRCATLDFEGVPDFDARVWAAAREIPCGTTVTYGALASAISEPGAARAVGAALGRNRFPIVVPCHRILAASGSGGFTAPGGRTTKMRLLEIERATLPGEAPGLFDALPMRLAPERR